MARTNVYGSVLDVRVIGRPCIHSLRQHPYPHESHFGLSECCELELLEEGLMTIVSASAAYATYRENVPLSDVVGALGHAGLDKESICLLLSPEHPLATIVRESNACAFEEKMKIEATLRAINWLSELGAVLIPTFGFFIRSRKFFCALGLDRSSISGCGLPGTLVSLGFSQIAAERFESQVKEVGVLMYVECTGVNQTRSALEILRATGADEAGQIESEGAIPPLVDESTLEHESLIAAGARC